MASYVCQGGPHAPRTDSGKIASVRTERKLTFVKTVRRYWIAGLVLLMVALHAVIIGYIRSQVAMLESARSTAITVGVFRFQPLRNPSQVYSFKLHAVLDPDRRIRGVEWIEQMRLEIIESSEQLLRQVDEEWLADPTQKELRAELLEVIQRHTNEPLVQRVLITDWLQLPSNSVAISVDSGLVSR